VIACASGPGDLVLDPFSGSATTRAAALRLGRRYLGIEKSEEFVHRSRLRLLGEQGQGPSAGGQEAAPGG
jgi:DNA modification methylase